MADSRSWRERLPTDLPKALVGGGIAAVVAALAVGTTGVASGAEARSLLQTIVPTIRFLTTAVITASATIMALMLTILSLSHSAEPRFEDRHYRRVQLIGTLSAVAIGGGVVLLLFLSIPTGESEVLSAWYEPIYYGIIVMSSALGGLQVAVVLMLREAITGMVDAVRPGGESSVVADEDDEEDRVG